MNINFSIFPVLETERMILRRPTHADASDLFEMRSDPEVMRYVPRPLAKTEDDVIELIDLINSFIDKNEKINWAMELKETGRVIGLISFVNIQPEHFRGEVGYSIQRAMFRKGYTSEALKRIIAFGFDELKLHTIEAIVDAENIPSFSLLEKAGFVREAYFREDFYFGNQFRNSVHYGMLNPAG